MADSNSGFSASVPGSPGADELTGLEEVLFYRFEDKSLLRLALTHESFANEHESRADNNERLEFLGDSVLGCIVCEYLYTHLPQQSEGVMAKIKGYVASTHYLAEKAREINLGSYLLLGHGEDSSGGRNGANVLADAMEAVIGAIYLDGGFAPAKTFVLSMLSSAMDAMEGAKCDYKSRLQELTQHLLHRLPSYVTVQESGPPHERLYEVAVQVDDAVLGQGCGHRKKDAGQEAAAQACQYLEMIIGFDLQHIQRLQMDAGAECAASVCKNREEPSAGQLHSGEIPIFMTDD